MQRPPQQRNAASDSTLSKLKLWFNKGSEIQSDHKASHQAIQDQQRNMGSTRYTTERNVHNVDGAVRRPATVSPLGPRQLPQAVHAEVRNDRYEGDQVSIFSSPQSTPPSSLTSAQSANPLAQMPRRKPSKANPRGLQISLPQPRQSLLNLASNYADVQNPEKKQPTPAAQVKSPLYKKNEQRSQEYRMEQPIKEVTKGQGQVMATPSHQRSQKAVVRKMAPQQTPKTDSHVRRETRFEDFMGKDSPPPPLPALSASLAPSTSTAFRLSRPFAESSEYDQHPTEDDDARPGTASTAALSRSDSRAQTWLRYDRQHGETIHQQRANNPPSLLVSRRNMTVPDRDQQFKEYTPCQSCRRQVHPSAAVSYNGVYECEDCAAAAAPKKQQHPKAGNLIIPRKPVPETPTPRTAFFADNHTPKYSTLSSSTTLRNTPSPQLSPRQSRPRNTDIPPGYEYLLSTTSPSPVSPLTPSPINPSFTIPNYRPPPPPPINTNTNIFSPYHNLQTPIRKAAPASSIYPSTPWRLSRPPSLPSVVWRDEDGGREREEERDTVYRAEVEEDLIDGYAVESPVSEGEYVNAGWRERRGG
ncbi:MAG: hypothetical protein Q9186_006477 [Xanthomendoza sp. 1 TL-2023]